MKQEGVDVYGK